MKFSFAPGILLFFIVLDLIGWLMEGRQAPKGREEEYARAMKLLKGLGNHGRDHLYAALLVIVLVVGGFLVPMGLWVGAGWIALYVLWFEEDALVTAGQGLRIS